MLALVARIERGRLVVVRYGGCEDLFGRRLERGGPQREEELVEGKVRVAKVELDCKSGTLVASTAKGRAVATRRSHPRPGAGPLHEVVLGQWGYSRLVETRQTGSLWVTSACEGVSAGAADSTAGLTSVTGLASSTATTGASTTALGVFSTLMLTGGGSGGA